MKSTVPPAPRLSPDTVEVIVAVSFGNQLCLVLIVVGIVWTVTSSPVWSQEPLWLALLVLGESPVYDACQW